MISFRAARYDDGDYVAEHLRPLDREELRVTNPALAPRTIIRQSLDLSEAQALTALDDGVPVAVMGLVPDYLAQEGVPWMLGTPRVSEFRRELIQWARPVIDHWLSRFPLILNEVWIGNEPAVRFLRHAGFTFAKPRKNEYGADMMLFYAKRGS